MQFHHFLARAIAHDLRIPLVPAARILGRIWHDAQARGSSPYTTFDTDNVGAIAAEQLGAASPSAFLAGVTGPGLAQDNMNDIEAGFADVMWADIWASKEEESGRTYSMNLVHEAPAKPDEAIVEAVFSVALIEAANRMTSDQIWNAAHAAEVEAIKARVAPNAVAGEIEEVERKHSFSPAGLGNNLYYETAGMGLRWSDDYAEIPGLDVPSREITLDCIDSGEYPLNRSLAVQIAEGYASGMHAADPGWHLYAFASTGGIVQSEEHRARLIDYLTTEGLAAAKLNDSADDTQPIFGATEEADIRALIAFIREEPVLPLENRYRRGEFYGSEPVELEIPGNTPRMG